MPHKAVSVVGSKVEIDTGSGFVEVLGAMDIKCPDGENSTFEMAGAGEAVNRQQGTGMSEVGTCSFSYYEDITDAVHQWIQDKALDDGGRDVDVKVTIGTSGKVKSGTGTLKTHSEEAAKKDGWKVSVEITLDNIWTVTHPA